MLSAMIIHGPGEGPCIFSSIDFGVFGRIELVGYAGGVEDGIDMVRELNPNLVLVDVELPDGCGFDVFEETKDLDYEKIIVSEKSRYIYKAIRYNVANYFVKPCDHREVQQAIAQLLFRQDGFMLQKMYREMVEMRPLLRLEHVLIPTISGPRMLDTGRILRIRDCEAFREIILDEGGPLYTLRSLSAIHRLLAFNGFFLLGNTLLSLENILHVDRLPEKTILHARDGCRFELPYHREAELISRLYHLGLESIVVR